MIPALAVLFALEGRIDPPARASVSLHGSTTPYSDSSLSDDRGRFVFRRLEPGPYTLSVLVPRRGEVRQTVQIGPAVADRKGRVRVTVTVDESRLVREEAWRGRATVSARELSIPERARSEYGQAQKMLGRRDVAAAIAHLERAVELAPQFAAAWNNLGTIAYQTRQYERAERCFRQSLEQDPESFEALVNLGGVLVTLVKIEEALEYNRRAVLRRPSDALANAQLGMSYAQAGNLDLAAKHLKEAKKLDPAHFSHPQLVLAEVYLRGGDRRAAAAEIDDFLRHHPDSPLRDQLRARVDELRR